ncbi:MAG: heavy metal translocating P-type ATPase [Coriobacteriia bacterium]
MTERATYRISGLDCPDCAKTVDKSVAAIDGVLYACLVFASGIMVVDYDPDADPRPELEDLVRRMGYGIEPAEGPHRAQGPAGIPRSHMIAVAGSGMLIGVGWVLSLLSGVPGVVSSAAYVLAAVVGGTQIYRRAIGSARAASLDMNVLMTVAIIGAIAIGEYSEAAMVVFLFSVGGLLEARSLARTRQSVRELMSLAPEIAHKVVDGKVVDVPSLECLPGDIVLVRPGERIPADGSVQEGFSAVDESPVTGESVPVEKEPGAQVWAGSLNTSGVLTMRVESLPGETTLARIIYLVEEAQARQAPFQRLVDRFTRWYTPAVVGLAVTIALLPPVIGHLMTGEGDFRTWFYRGLVLLVVSCPCALVIATPVSIVSAITRSSRDGVLVKGGAFLELAPQIRAFAFDKTGTLTRGRPEVGSIVPFGGSDPAAVLEIAAALESQSTHPLAQAIVRARGEVELTVGRLRDVTEQAGRGVRGTFDGVDYLVGRPLFAEAAGITDPTLTEEIERLETAGETTIVVIRLGDIPVVLGVLGLRDSVREDAAQSVAALRAAGIEHLVMLTGDNERVAAQIAAQVGISEYRAGLLPQDKTSAIEELKERYGYVAMIGDGINDAPALALADIGIAMGAAGSDAALEAADVALMSDDLDVLPGFFALGRRTLRIIRQNVWFSIVIKFVVLIAAMAGYAQLWLAVFADTGVALLVIFNGLRLLRAPRRSFVWEAKADD